MAITSQKNGVSVAAVAGKMAVIIPVLFGVLLYKEHLTPQKILGISFALMCCIFHYQKK